MADVERQDGTARGAGDTRDFEQPLTPEDLGVLRHAARFKLDVTRSLFWPEPENDDVVEQRLTVCADGRVYVTDVPWSHLCRRLADGPKEPSVRPKLSHREGAARAVRELCDAVEGLRLKMVPIVCDSGTYALKTTAQDGRTLEVDGSPEAIPREVIERLRETLGMPGLFGFLG